ncbi:HAD-IA family hydrolase [Chroococcidiopsis sp. CCMEE 29]|uniref:HAD family hydrolase n=1 Tax=Chroococcidiopsis sp. CCMEE 29 TaxID=155894 RepID=UPI0020217EFA|nr:HAD-IA family hydrolase [Chroococcidiopsis sp. CCMEE 29]
MLAAILYDLDGTIVNTDPLHYQAWQQLLRDYEIEIDEQFYKTRISGRLNPIIVQELLPELSPEAVQKFSDRKEARFRELAPELTPLPGLLNLIEWADQRGLKQAVVTNAPRQNADYMLKVLHLQDKFDQVVVSEEVGIPKPDPTPYRHILNYFGLSPEQALAFEDSPSGIRAAVGAGIPTVGIASTQEPEDLYELGAMLVIHDFTDSQLWELLGVSNPVALKN